LTIIGDANVEKAAAAAPPVKVLRKLERDCSPLTAESDVEVDLPLKAGEKPCVKVKVDKIAKIVEVRMVACVSVM